MNRILTAAIATIGLCGFASAQEDDHQAMKKRYPNRKPAHGEVYGGIENLRPETIRLIENLKLSQSIISGEN